MTLKSSTELCLNISICCFEFRGNAVFLFENFLIICGLSSVKQNLIAEGKWSKYNMCYCKICHSVEPGLLKVNNMVLLFLITGVQRSASSPTGGCKQSWPLSCFFTRNNYLRKSISVTWIFASYFLCHKTCVPNRDPNPPIPPPHPQDRWGAFFTIWGEKLLTSAVFHFNFPLATSFLWNVPPRRHLGSANATNTDRMSAKSGRTKHRN